MIPMFSDAIAMARLDELRRESKQWRLARLARASPGAEGSRKPAWRRLILSAIASRFRNVRTDQPTREQTP